MTREEAGAKLADEYASKHWSGDDYTAAFDSFIAGYQAALTPQPSAEDAAVLDAVEKIAGFVAEGRHSDAVAVLARMAGKVPEGWSKIDDDTPERCIVASWNARQKMWVVGEAYRHEDGAWWWANESAGDYYAEAININLDPPELWHPLPAAPKVPT